MEDSGLLHNKEEPDVMRQLATGEMEMLYSDKEPIHLKTKADMKKAARENYAIASEMNRIHQMTSKLGEWTFKTVIVIAKSCACVYDINVQLCLVCDSFVNKNRKAEEDICRFGSGNQDRGDDEDKESARVENR